MIHCSQCSYAWNPDTATNCVQCKAQLAAQRRGGTQNEGLASDSVRRQTVAEGVSSGVSAPPNIREMGKPEISRPEMAKPDIPQARWGHAQAAERAERRRTVFAGTPVASESFAPGSASGPAGGSSAGLSAGENRRPQTSAVDPNRRIVGVLITYSWQPQGEIFPVLEGRNLIGKDPDQCDICIPQDSTLSAVNSFITYRRQFVIGDRVSMSGTDVDGEPIESEFVPLHNYAKIRTGSTHWTFVEIPPPSLQASETKGNAV